MIVHEHFKDKKPSLHVVMHVPKTAGASVSGGLQKTFGDKRVLRCDWFDQLLFHSKTRGLSGYDVIICHISGRELSYLTDDFDLTLSTFLRDPIARVFSNYCFWRQFTPDVLLNVGTRQVPLIDLQIDWKEDLSRILSQASEIWKFRELVNVSTWQFATSLYERAGRSESQALSEAKKRLQSMILIGFHENLHSDYEALVHHIDPSIPPSPLEQLNKTKRHDGLTLDDETRSLIKEHNALDVELYRWAQDKFA